MSIVKGSPQLQAVKALLLNSIKSYSIIKGLWLAVGGTVQFHTKIATTFFLDVTSAIIGVTILILIF